MSENQPPFKDLLVIELATVLAGPSVGMFFAELGARVIKVENPATAGDVTRGWKTPKENTETDLSAYFLSANWGKESIGINLKTQKGKELLYKLVEKADVLIANYKPGDAEMLSVDYQTLSRINPGIVYAGLTAYGEDDPRPGFDAIIQAESGFMYMNGTPDSGPVKMPVALMDVLAAHQMKEAILIALLDRERTGTGSEVKVSLIGAGISALVNQATNWLHAGHEPRRIGSAHPNIVPYGNVFRTMDNEYIVLAVGSDRQFSNLCKVLNVEDISHDKRFISNVERVKHQDVLIPLLETKISTWNRDHLLNKLANQNVPAGAVRKVSQVFEQPTGLNQVLQGKTSMGEPIKGVSQIAFKHNKSKTARLNTAPAAFEHTTCILKNELDLPEEVIQEFISNNIIR